MKKTAMSAALLFFLVIVFVPGPVSYAANEKSRKLWNNMCASCHNGKAAPSAETLRSKYGTVDDFVAAVRGKGGRCMNVLKNSEPMMRKIAGEIGIREARAK